MNAAAQTKEVWIKDTTQSNLPNMVANRDAQYGGFANNAELTQELTDSMRCNPGWENLNAVHREGLEMIAHKVSRIINGDPDYIDSWDDLAGYATITAKCIRESKT